MSKQSSLVVDPPDGRIPALSDELMFEYACHEANDALEGVLKGARYQETQAATPQK